MAKNKTAADLKEEAKKIREEAKKRERVLLKQAQDLEALNYAQLGEKAKMFLMSKITENELMDFAVGLGLIVSENDNATKSDDNSIKA